MSGPVNQFQV
ncbi:hypothetical protein AYI69_g4568, partial [Smittium culicis]